MTIVSVLAVIMGILFGLIVVGGFFFGFLKVVFPDFSHFWKYKIRKKAPKEKDVEFLMSLIEKGIKRENVMKEALLTNRYSMKRAEELSFLFLEVEKSLKGGKDE